MMAILRVWPKYVQDVIGLDQRNEKKLENFALILMQVYKVYRQNDFYGTLLMPTVPAGYETGWASEPVWSLWRWEDSRLYPGPIRDSLDTQPVT
jgi:hypothetical protein